jgi:hypothetical protein
VFDAMDLASLQHAFQQHVLNGDGPAAAYVNRSDEISAHERLQVYSDAYRLRLTDALAHNFPRLHELLGHEQFDPLAGDYLRAHPSALPSVRWIGEHLAQFLTVRSVSPAFIDLAHWEWAIAAAFDAGDAESLQAQELSDIPADDWPVLRFAFHPSLQLLMTQSNAVSMFKALTDQQPVPKPESQSEQWWLIWRHRFTPRYRSIQPDERAALSEALNQGTFDAICAVLSERHTADQAAVRAITLLKTWLAEELLTGLSKQGAAQ